MQNIKEVIINQQKALQEQRSRVAHEDGYSKGSGNSGEGEFGEDGFDEKAEGGFAGGDPKKRRGVCLPWLFAQAKF